MPSPKTEPIKLWLAKVGYERIQDISDPARSIDRAREYWQQHGRSGKWIQQRMIGQETRNKIVIAEFLVSETDKIDALSAKVILNTNKTLLTMRGWKK